MKVRLLLICSALLLLTINLHAQSHSKRTHKNGHSGNRSTLLDAGEGDYDIKHLKFNLNVSDTSLHISGNVSTTAKVIAPSMSAYMFELDTLMVIDSAKVNGELLPVSTSVTPTGFLRTMILPTALPAGATFTAQVFYHGVPPAGGGFFNGVTKAVLDGVPMIYTISDPWVAADWWPAKQSVDDKIDSVDMFITVPAGQVDGSNGLLVNIDSTSVPGFWTYHWQTHYAINYYLISMSVSQYVQERYYHHFAGSTDSMLIQNFFVDTASFYPLYKAGFDSLGMIMDYYDSLYGRYPFWKEKYGVCYTTLPGGMEHQTMTTIGVPYTWVIAHELTHQWFGDNVSYQTWPDVWLSEGFATFDEQLFYTHFRGPAAGLAHRQMYLTQALGDPCGEVYVTDTSSANTLFYQPTVYAKGQGVVTMLRYLAPNDSLFFKGLRTYQQTYSYGNASTADLKAIMEATYGFALDTFFNQWIYGSGYPVYRVTWNQIGTNVYVKLIQTQSCPATTNHFSTPIELQLRSAASDSIVKVYNSIDTQVFMLTWPVTMDSLVLNPDVWTICRGIGRVTRDTTLGVVAGINNIIPKNVTIQPNPTNNYWLIEQLPEDTGLMLTDMSGRILWQGKSGKGYTIIPGDKLPPGDYLLKLQGSNNTESIKLVHW